MDGAGTADGGVEANKDDWHNVTDAKKRKQIQDRLAQRARRKRLREAAKSQKQTSRAPAGSTSDGQSSETSNVPAALGPGPAQQGSLQLVLRSDSAAVSSSPSSSSSLPQNPPCHPSRTAQGPSISYDLPISTAVLSALMINGRVLGLSAATCVPGRSTPASPDVPLSLHPTTLQLLNVHHIGLDQFPFAKMRDNAIVYGGLYDDEQFAMDLCIMPSFRITPGAAAWDPTAWKMEKCFAEKWGFLFRELSLLLDEELNRETLRA